MKRKNVFWLIMIVCLLSLSNCGVMAINPSIEKTSKEIVSIEETTITDDEQEVIKKFSLKNKFQRSPEAQIESLFKKLTKYSEKNDNEKLKSLYSDSYVNNDGFNKKIIFELVEQSASSYKDVDYENIIESIEVTGNYAVVKAREIAKGTTLVKQPKTDDYGDVYSDIHYTDYLQKEGKDWKITASIVNSEKVSLKHGDAKNIDIDIIAPETVPANTEYEVKVTTTSLDGTMMFGSIVNEQIVFPQISKKDVFRAIRSDKLERLLTSNSDKNNEYAAVTIGITRPKVVPPDLKFDMTGMAFVMKRVNVVSPAENKENILNNKEIANVED